MTNRDDMQTPDGAALPDKPARFQSPPESIALAREVMRDIKVALTRGTDGEFTAGYSEVDWEGLNMQPPRIAWQDMGIGDRYELLAHALDGSVWSLEPPAAWDEPRDSQKLAAEFVRDEERQLHAEWRHDYGLRFLEDRGVKYEDAADRQLDYGDFAERTGLPSSDLAGRQPPHPWPSEIAKENRQLSQQEGSTIHVREQAHANDGHSI
jgi:hypothetical protein